MENKVYIPFTFKGKDGSIVSMTSIEEISDFQRSDNYPSGDNEQEFTDAWDAYIWDFIVWTAENNKKKDKDSDDDSKSGKGTLTPLLFGRPTGRGTMFGRGDETTESMVWWYLKQMGLTDEGAAGVMGNMQAESGINPTNLQDSYETSLGYSDDSYTKAVDEGKYKNFINDEAGYGLVQFTYHTLKEDLYNRAKDEKKSIGSLSVQLETLEQQLNNNHGDMLAKLKKTKSVKEASNAFLHGYENPADQSASVENARASLGE